MKIDNKVDKLNKKISKLLGKKSQNQPSTNGNNNHGVGGEVVNDWAYFIAICVCIVLLWLASGLYYVGDGYYGIVISNGSLSKVVGGPKMGVTLPMPFGSVQMVAKSSGNLKSLGIMGDGNTYQSVTKDGMPVLVNGLYSFQIVDPAKLYTKIDLSEDNLTEMVRLNTLSVLYTTLRLESYAGLKNSNLTILGNKIKHDTNIRLNSYGVMLTKLSINNLYTANSKSSPMLGNNINIGNVATARMIASRLIQEAKSYQIDQLAYARVAAKSYPELMEAYAKIPDATARQMYYDALVSVDSQSQYKHYDYLFLSLSELYNQLIGSDEVNRDVIRTRVLGR